MPKSSVAKASRWSFALIGALLTLPSPAFADDEDYLPVAERQIDPPRPVAVLVPQARMASSIELGRIAFPGGGGGLLGALIIDGQNGIPERLAAGALARAEVRIQPLTQELHGFDVDALAVDATNAVLTATPWVGAGPPSLFTGTREAGAPIGEEPGVNVSSTYGVGYFGEPAANRTEAAQIWADSVSEAKEQFIAAHPDAAQMAQFMWRYQMSPDFSQVQVIADVSIAASDARQPFYAQQLISIVRLNRPSYVEEENVARWVRNDGTAVRAALASAFARAGEVLPHIMALDEEGFEHASNRKRKDKVTSAGYHGPVLLRDETGPVFWAKDGDQRLAAFITVQVAAE